MMGSCLKRNIKSITQKCKDCMFFEPHEHSEFRGDCHRYPPVTTGNRWAANFNCVDPDWWCGEFEEMTV